jgi:hypothetical protein
MSKKPKKKPPTLTERVKNLESVVKGSETDWSLTEIQGILNRTNLTPEMGEQELLDLSARVQMIEDLIDYLGKSESHTGPQTIKHRLDIIEGNLEILHSSHLGHTNYAPAEFRQMHGFVPGNTKNSEPLESDIGRCLRLMTELRDLILKFREDEDEDGYYLVEASIELLADAAGMEANVK